MNNRSTIILIKSRVLITKNNKSEIESSNVEILQLNISVYTSKLFMEAIMYVKMQITYSQVSQVLE